MKKIDTREHGQRTFRCVISDSSRYLMDYGFGVWRVVAIFLLYWVAQFTAEGSDLIFGDIGMEALSIFEKKSLYGNECLDSEKWEELTYQILSDRTFMTQVELPREAFSLSAYEAIRNGRACEFLEIEGGMTIELFAAYLNGLLKSKDKYAEWESPLAISASRAIYKGHYEGIGVGWGPNNKDGRVEVLWVAKGGPCGRAGIKPLDILTGLIIDGNRFALENLSLTELISEIKRGDAIRLQFDERVIDVTAEPIVIDEVKNEIIESDDSIIFRWRSVNRESARLTRSAIRRAKKTKKQLVLDLTENRGGMTQDALEVIGAFIPSKYTGVQWQYNDQYGRDRTYELISFSKHEWKGELIVHVGSRTASAAEIVKIALSQRDNTTIKGGNTYGKHEAQDLISMSSGGRIRSTVARFKAIH